VLANQSEIAGSVVKSKTRQLGLCVWVCATYQKSSNQIQESRYVDIRVTCEKGCSEARLRKIWRQLQYELYLIEVILALLIIVKVEIGVKFLALLISVNEKIGVKLLALLYIRTFCGTSLRGFLRGVCRSKTHDGCERAEDKIELHL